MFDVQSLATQLTSEVIEIPVPERFVEKISVAAVGSSGAQNPNGTNTLSTGTAKAHEINGEKIIYYKTLTWGSVVADFSDFRGKVSETLNDARGWENCHVRRGIMKLLLTTKGGARGQRRAEAREWQREIINTWSSITKLDIGSDIITTKRVARMAGWRRLCSSNRRD